MEMIPRSEFPGSVPTHSHNDHADAWLMSYADLITLLFMFLIIFVSVAYSKQTMTNVHTQGEPEHPRIIQHYGLLTLATTYDESFRALMGIVQENSADHDIAVEKTDRGLLVDMAAPMFFASGSADILPAQRVLLESIIASLKTLPKESTIEVAGYTDDAPLEHSAFANNWELSAMRATRVASLMINAGIDASRLHAASYGDTHPAVPNNDTEGNPIAQNHMRNQRVIIRIDSPPELPAAEQ